MTAPAIRTRMANLNGEKIRTIGSNTRFQRGLGDMGTRVELWDHDCPRCEADEMVASVDVNPSMSETTVALYCTNVACPHFVGDEVEYDMDRIRADEPHIWDNTAECPDCGDRHTVQIERDTLLHERADAGTSVIVEVPCDTCEESEVTA